MPGAVGHTQRSQVAAVDPDQGTAAILPHWGDMWSFLVLCRRSQRTTLMLTRSMRD